MKALRFYKDEIYELTAWAINRTMAWGMIRNRCHELKIEVPTIDQIILV